MPYVGAQATRKVDGRSSRSSTFIHNCASDLSLPITCSCGDRDQVHNESPLCSKTQAATLTQAGWDRYRPFDRTFIPVFALRAVYPARVLLSWLRVTAISRLSPQYVHASPKRRPWFATPADSIRFGGSAIKKHDVPGPLGPGFRVHRPKAGSGPLCTGGES